MNMIEKKKKVGKGCFSCNYKVPKKILENYLQAVMERDRFSIQMYTLTMLYYCPEDKRKDMAEDIELLLQKELGENYDKFCKWSKTGEYDG